MQAKYDWLRLKSTFVTGHWLTVASFFRDQGIKNNSRSRQSARGWHEERRKYQESIALKTRQKVIEDEVSIRSRQHKIAKQMQLKGVRDLNRLDVRNVDDARKLVVDGMREERTALGLDNIRREANLTQVNVSLPQTRFDDLLENASYEELLELIAAVRREKSRRSDNIVTDSDKLLVIS